MSLRVQLLLAADRIAMVEQWLNHGDLDQAREAIQGIHDQLVTLAQETDR